MSGIPLFHAVFLAASVAVLVVATQSLRLHPFLAMLFVASGFGLATGLSVSLVGKAFGAGFSQAIYSPGLAVVAAGLVAGLAESAGASGRLTAAIDRRRSLLGSTRLAALLGLIAGIGASPATALAILAPVVPSIAGGTATNRTAIPLTLSLAISASHGLVLFSPVVIAATAIIDAPWSRVALFGLPVAILSVAFGAAWARWLASAGAAPQPRAAAKEIDPAATTRRGWPAAALVLAAVIPLSFLIVQSLGAIPSEPLGGGTARELVLGIGRPLVLFLAGLAIMTVGSWRTSAKLLAESGWTARVLGNVAGIVLIVGAAGGLQRLCQETGMAELIGERVAFWHIGGLGALAIPFLIAAAIKTLQGSSLVAAITAAGMVQPILMPLGLDGDSGKALAALAVGAGAMTVSHINDELFWLAAEGAGLSPLRGLAKFSAGTLLQGVIAVAALLILAALISGV